MMINYLRNKTMDKFHAQYKKLLEGSTYDKMYKLQNEIEMLESQLDEKHELLESMRLSAGMLNGFRKTANIKHECNGCGFGIPRYKGRYPNYCPSCGEKLEASDKKLQDIEPIEED